MHVDRSWRLRDVLAAVGLFLLTLDFILWQNTLVAALWDVGLLLDTAFRLTLGQLPYRDFPLSSAPLTFLVQAGLIQLFGRFYFVQIFYAAFAGGLATLLLWRIVIHLLRPLQGAWPIATLLAAPLAFLGIYSIYSQPTSDSDCILAVLAAIYLLLRAHEHRTRNALAGAACVLPLSFQQRIGLTFLIAMLASVSAIAFARTRKRLSIHPQLFFLGAACTSLAAALLILQATVGLQNYFDSTVGHASPGSSPAPDILLGIYSQPSLLWSIPAAVAALFILRVRQLWATSAAILLLISPFLWTVFSLTLTGDRTGRADQLHELWPHLLLLAAALALYRLRRPLTVRTLLPFILLATIHSSLLYQQPGGSTYAVWPLLILVLACLLIEIPTIALPVAATVAASLLLCGGLYATSHQQLSYVHLDGTQDGSTAPHMSGLATPGPWIPAFDELLRYVKTEIPASDGILLIPNEEPFFFATGRTPQFPVLRFDPAADPYTPQQTLDQARSHNIRWLIVKRDLQLTALPDPRLPEILRVLEPDFKLYYTLSNYNIYRRTQAHP